MPSICETVIQSGEVSWLVGSEGSESAHALHHRAKDAHILINAYLSSDPSLLCTAYASLWMTECSGR